MAARYDDDDVVDTILDMHGLSDDKQEALSLAQYTATTVMVGQDDTSFLLLYRRAAKRQEMDLPSPPPSHKPLQFAEF